MIQKIFLLLIIIAFHVSMGMDLTLQNYSYIVSHLDKRMDQIEKNIKTTDTKKKQLGYDAELLLLLKKTIPDIQEKIVTLMLQSTHNDEFPLDRKSTRLNSSHLVISYAV